MKKRHRDCASEAQAKKGRKKKYMEARCRSKLKKGEDQKEENANVDTVGTRLRQ